jgi:hypothetical protein
MVWETNEPAEFLEFVHTADFADSIEELLSETDVHALENELLRHPELGRLIPGTGGVRKMRFALPGRGKSSGVRVLYVYARHDSRIYFLLAYAKNVRTTLTQADKNALKAWVRQL